MAPQIKTEQEMFPLVEAWHASGLTQKQFCIDHRLPVHILVYWVGRYRKAQPAKATVDKAVVTLNKATKALAAESASGFIRLGPPPTPSPVPASAPSLALPPIGSMEVVLPSGAIIRFSTTVAAGYLKELLSVCSH